MNGYLRQSTASQSRTIGPFVDSTDFVTLKTGLTIANTDIKLRANGTTLSNKNSGGGTHQVNGEYSVTWDATDTANVGELSFTVSVAGALVVFGKYVVLEEAVYDALFAASAAGIPSIPAGWLTAAGIAADTGLKSVRSGTAQAGASQSITLDTGASATNDLYNRNRIILTGGTGAGQSRLIVNYTGATKVADVDSTWNVEPDATTTFAIQPATTDVAAFVGDNLAVFTLANEIANIAGRIDAAISTRMATYAQPTGFLAATFPASPAAVGSAMMLANNAITTASIADGAITDAKITTPAETAGRPTGILAMIRRLFEWRSNKRIRTRSTGALQLRNAADSADLETQNQSSTGPSGSEVDTQTKGV